MWSIEINRGAMDAVGVVAVSVVGADRAAAVVDDDMDMQSK